MGYLRRVLIGVLSCLALGAFTATAQTTSGEKASKAARTPDGHPDLAGTWSNAVLIPLERPKELGAKEFLTDEDIAAGKTVKGRAKEGADTRFCVGCAQEGTPEDVHYDSSQFGLDREQADIAPTRRTSLIVGPDGRVPPMLPEAKAQAAQRAAANAKHEYDGPENRPLSERCILMGQEVVPMLPGGYNNNLQIVQGAGYVSIMTEMNHSVRVIPTDGRPHLPATIRQWRGDSRGHWEGDVLVVDVTNFTDRNPFRGSSDHLHVVERFVVINKDTIRYQFTVEDPKTWDKPWSAELDMPRVKGPIYEFACNEGNRGMANTLSGARHKEEIAAKKDAK
jgi:hypothetical protein